MKQDEGKKVNDIVSDANENANLYCHNPCSFSMITLSESTETISLKAIGTRHILMTHSTHVARQILI